ncbi:MAG: TonB-dependent receptor [Gammaproteobacteria bacterium]|nr:TonB-dependent receptor [Gammaproteobacteria bacterium]
MKLIRPGLLFAATLFALPSLAQTAASSGSAGTTEAAPLAEVVVTAEKRSEPLHEVPAAVSVVTGSALTAAGINNAESLGELVPTVTFKRGSTNSNSTLAVRGIGTQSFSPAAEPSVAFVVDGVVMGRPGMTTTEFTDIQRIEVLDGPQGTLFGINASAGVINIVTPDPTRAFEGDASVSWSQGSEYHAALDLSGPVNDRIGYTLSAIYASYPGNIYNVYDREQTNGFHRKGVRGKLVYDITDSLKLTLAGDYVHANDDCCADVLGTYVPNAQWTNVFLPELAPSAPGPRSLNVNNDFIPSQIDTSTGASATLQWRVGGDTLTSISAFRRWYNFQGRDGDFHSGCCSYVAPLDITLHDRGGLDYKQYSEELRLASPTDQLVEYVAGAFIWHTDEQDYFIRHDRQCTKSTLPADATGFAPCEPGLSTYLDTSGQANFDTRDDNEALFGQATINVSKRLRMIAGGRFTRDYVSYSFARVDQPSTGPGIGAPFQGAGNTSEHGWSGKAGVQYDFTRAVMGYATYARGWKGPAYNVFFNMSALNTAPIAPETSTDYEMGLKSVLFDDRLVLNLSAFYETFDNFQANSFVVTNGAVTTSLTNAGQVRSKGVSLDFNWRPIDSVTVSGGYAYDKAYIVSYMCAGQVGGALATCRGVHDGGMLPFAPQSKLDITPSWLLPLQGAPFTARLSVSYDYTSLTSFDIDQDPIARQPAYSLLGATLDFGFHQDDYHLALIGRNLTNQFYTAFITPTGSGFSPGAYARLQVPRDASRYFGVRLSMSF